jgi:phenylpropionate dioxygenase-like ring-hydroxylating dioxygenase large terminal subunit
LNVFLHDTRLPHLLAPACYHSAEFYARELAQVLFPAWHMVGSKHDVARPGDFITCELLGTPVQVRNCDGALRAMSNVCAHRHCLLSSLPRGHAPRLRCQYHGWEYDYDGRTGKIPSPKNFVPFDRDQDCLPLYRVDTCGQLVFVSLAPSGPSLRDQLGDMYERLAERFGATWRERLSWQPTYEANWKVAVENTLEAYHVPYVHPHTFRENPGSERSTHVLHERHTWFGTDLPFSPHSRLDAWFQRCEGFLARRLGDVPQGRYQHHHIFPNLLVSFTDMISLCQCVLPTSPTTSVAVVRQFGNVGRRSGLWSQLAKVWGTLEAAITRTILREDQGMLREIQRGLAASPHVGVLGACEERIWAFQSWLKQQCDAAAEGSG